MLKNVSFWPLFLVFGAVPLPLYIWAVLSLTLG